MSNRFRNISRQQRIARNIRTDGGFARRQRLQQDSVLTTFDTATLTPRPVTKSKNTVVFDLHGGIFTYFQFTEALEQQFDATDILMVGHLLGSDYCQPDCTMAEVLFASPEARRLAITRGITLEGIQYLGVPVIDNISYKDVYGFQTPLLQWPDNVPEFNNTTGTVFLVENLPLETVDVMIDKVKKSVDAPSTSSSNEPSSSLGKKAHPLITIFAKRHVASSFARNMVYVVVHGHVNSFSVFKKVNGLGHDTVHLPEYNNICPQGFDFWRFQFDRVFCFNCDKPDCHFTEDCNGIRIAKLFRSHLDPQMP